MFRTTLKFFCAFLALVSLGKFASAQTNPQKKPIPDVLIFNNGDQLTGKLQRATGGSVVFKSDMAGEVTVSVDKIKELRSDGGFAVLRKEPKPSRTPPPAAVGNIKIAAGIVTVQTAPATTSLPAKDVAYIVDEKTYQAQIANHPGLLSGWNGALSAGATLVRSTTNATTYTTGATLVRAVPSVPYLPARNRTSFNLSETYGELTTPNNPVAGLVYSRVKSHIFHTDFERDEYFSPRFFALAQTSFDHNYAQGLSLQQNYGVGIGYTPVKTARQQLDLKADVHFERQSFFALTANTTPSPTLDLVGSTFADTYRLSLPRKLVFTETANILPAFNNTMAYSANVTGTIALPVYKRLAAQFSTTDNYLNNPSAGFRKNSYQYVTGITFSIH